jgi:hypothetical protein
VLDQIFSYVGGGDHLYTGGVSRRWRGRYLQHCAQAGNSAQEKKCVIRHRSTIISESRLRHAHSCGFDVACVVTTQDKYANLLCAHSLEPERVATVVRLHGGPWDNVICRKAACLGQLRMLQCLHSNGCQWDELNVLLNASRSGSVPMLEWLKTVTKPWSESCRAAMLNDAASCERLAAAQWFKANGAQWPTAFASEYLDISQVSQKQCWSVSTVQWAVAAGSGWREWKCEDYAAEKYRLQHMKQRAAGVLTWAHANGCPCTCGNQQQQQ